MKSLGRLAIIWSAVVAFLLTPVGLFAQCWAPAQMQKTVNVQLTQVARSPAICRRRLLTQVADKGLPAPFFVMPDTSIC